MPPVQRKMRQPQSPIRPAESTRRPPRGNGEALPAPSTIWKASVRRRPSTSGAPGSTMARTKMIPAARAAAGRTIGHARSRAIRKELAPASRAASSHDGSSRRNEDSQARATRAAPAGNVAQIHMSQSGTPDHASRLAPGFRRQSLRMAKASARAHRINLSTRARKTPVRPPRPPQPPRRRPIAPEATPEQVASSDRPPGPASSPKPRTREDHALAAQVQAKSSNNQSTRGKK